MVWDLLYQGDEREGGDSHIFHRRQADLHGLHCPNWDGQPEHRAVQVGHPFDPSFMSPYISVTAQCKVTDFIDQIVL